MGRPRGVLVACSKLPGASGECLGASGVWWSGSQVGLTALGRAVKWIRQPRNSAGPAEIKSTQVVRLSILPVID